MSQIINEESLENQLDKMVRELVKEKIELIMQEEMAQYFTNDRPDLKNAKNGNYQRNLDTKYGRIENLNVPRDRQNHFTTSVFQPYQRYQEWLGESIIQMYQNGMSTREIARFVERVLGDSYSPATISHITDVLEEDIHNWQKRELDERYSVIYLDGTYLKLRRNDVDSEVVYIVLGVKEDGTKEILGFEVGGKESANGWENVLRKLRERGMKEVLLGVFDGLPGLEEAMKRVFPRADIQRCVVHKIRNTMHSVRKKDRKEITGDIKTIYNAESREAADDAFKEVSDKWSKLYPKVIKSWAEDLDVLLTFYKYPASIRRQIYSTNIIERLMREVKKRTHSIPSFPTEKAVEKLIYLTSIQYNKKMETKTATGFKLAHEDLQQMFWERYRKEAE
jgi:putative transposase